MEAEKQTQEEQEKAATGIRKGLFREQKTNGGTLSFLYYVVPK